MRAYERLWAVIIMITLFIVIVSLTIIAMDNRSESEKIRMTGLIEAKSANISDDLSRLTYKAHVLKELIVSGEKENFRQIASVMINDPIVAALAIAPEGVISDVYPMEGNEIILGLNLFDESYAGNLEAIKARDTKEIVIAGPFEYIQGGIGMAARIPIYLDTPDGDEKFWGIASVSLEYPQILDITGLNIIESQGYEYEIWRINPDNGERQTIVQSGMQNVKTDETYLETSIRMLNTEWYLRIMPLNEWYDYPETWMIIIIAALVSALACSIIVSNLKMEQSRREVREVNERLENVINTAPISYMAISGGLIKELNDNMSRSTGLSVGDDPTHNYKYLFERHRIAEKFRENDAVSEIMEVSMRDGETRRCLVNISHFDYKKIGELVLWAVDVENSEKQKDRLRTVQQSLQTVLDTLPVAVKVTDCETGKIVYINKYCLELFEFDSYDRAYETAISDTMPEFQSDGMPSSEKIKSIQSKTGPESMFFEYLSVNGKLIDSLIRISVIDYNGRQSTITIINDLSKERREEELRKAALVAEEASRAKTLFLANMSHEIRTPMNGIIGFTELALESRSIPEIIDYLNKIKDSSEILFNIINDILDISKIEANKMELESMPFDIHEIFRVCNTVITPRAQRKGIELHFYVEPLTGRKLIGDSTRLRQALLNLLSNAVKFTNEGTVKLTCTVEETTENSVEMSFEVKDSGIGISPEQMDNILNPFMQADLSATREYGGTGLGLAITMNIIKLMGGKLIVESEPGVGSRFSFTITFPAIEDSSESEVSEVYETDGEKPTFSGEVLVFEDNVMNQQVIRNHLSRVGLEMIAADNGRIGVNLVKSRIEHGEKPFDLIFMDMHMPIMDGLEAANNLKLIGCETPVVALTANIMADERKIYKKNGINDYVGKPFKSQDLWRCLLKYLKPIGWDNIAVGEEKSLEDKQRAKLLLNFIQDNQTTFDDIMSAIDKKDIKLAHRLAHTLKGTAGLIGKSNLSEAARVVEKALESGKAADLQNLLETLEYELEEVIDELKPLLDKPRTKPPTESIETTEALELLDKLEILLNASDSDCLDLIDDLDKIRGTHHLINQIERYDFQQAKATLEAVRREMNLERKNPQQRH